jgi:hypothetical protein
VESFLLLLSGVRRRKYKPGFVEPSLCLKPSLCRTPSSLWTLDTQKIDRHVKNILFPYIRNPKESRL